MNWLKKTLIHRKQLDRVTIWNSHQRFRCQVRLAVANSTSWSMEWPLWIDQWRQMQFVAIEFDWHLCSRQCSQRINDPIPMWCQCIWLVCSHCSREMCRWHVWPCVRTVRNSRPMQRVWRAPKSHSVCVSTLQRWSAIWQIHWLPIGLAYVWVVAAVVAMAYRSMHTT